MVVVTGGQLPAAVISCTFPDPCSQRLCRNRGSGSGTVATSCCDLPRGRVLLGHCILLWDRNSPQQQRPSGGAPDQLCAIQQPSRMGEERQVPSQGIETTRAHAVSYLPGHGANESVWKRMRGREK